MKETNSPTCIICILLHIEDIFWHLFRVEGLSLLGFELHLWLSHFIEKQYSEHWFGDHFECPVFSGKHLLEGKEFCFESHLCYVGVDDFGVGLKWLPVFLFLLHLKDNNNKEVLKNIKY